MRVTLNHVTRLVATGEHNAFTDLCAWRGDYYVAYRQAYSHGIVPPGDIAIARIVDATSQRPVAERIATLHHFLGDCRDPKFIVTDTALYCYCGVYLPMPQQFHATLSEVPAENLLMTHVSFTTGKNWAPLQPILRPNYWAWSHVIAGTRQGHLLASYHVGTPGERSSSIALWSSNSPLHFQHNGVIYDGASTTRDADGRYDMTHNIPSEPVLYRPGPDLLACCLRTEDSLEIGVALAPYQDTWRWWDTKKLIHPSAILHTPYGWLLAGRALTPVYDNTRKARQDQRRLQKAFPELPASALRKPLYHETVTALWHVEAQHVTPLLALPSGGDTGYAGVCAGRKPGEYLLSYYSQHNYYDVRGIALLPSADIYLATIHVEG